MTTMTQKHASIDTLTVNVKNKITATVTPLGTDGAQTINTPAGTVNFAVGATSLVVTSSLCTTNSIVIAVVRTDDSGGTGVGNASVFSVIPANGSFTINLSGPPLTEVSVGFMVYN